MPDNVLIADFPANSIKIKNDNELDNVTGPAYAGFSQRALSLMSGRLFRSAGNPPQTPLHANLLLASEAVVGAGNVDNLEMP